MKPGLSRRQVLKGGGMIAVGLMAPRWLSTVARADVRRLAYGEAVAPDNVLVVCQLSGGNDGLNTVVPYANPEYYRLRPRLAIPEAEVLKANEDLGFHPSLEGFKSLFDQGKVAVVNNVGYPNPNRSHFKSMEIWQSASPEGKVPNGWIGRYFDDLMDQGEVSPVAGFGLSTDTPRALQAENASIPCFASLQDISNMVGDPEMEARLREIQGLAAQEGSAVRAIQDANLSALDAMGALHENLGKYQSQSQYENDNFGRGFKQIAHLIATSPETRVIYFSTGGFDTHNRQAESHANLMQQFGNALATFQDELAAIGRADKVTTMVFSEFGRRAYENDSVGTDHGKAGPMMLIGENVKGGFHGGLPDLTNLDAGDVPHRIDFRSVYADALESWLGADSGTILGTDIEKTGLFG